MNIFSKENYLYLNKKGEKYNSNHTRINDVKKVKEKRELFFKKKNKKKILAGGLISENLNYH